MSKEADLKRLVAELEQELERMTEINHSIATCADHTERMFHTEEIPCLACALDEAHDEIATLRDNVKRNA